jgi:hypothetical protein
VREDALELAAAETRGGVVLVGAADGRSESSALAIDWVDLARFIARLNFSFLLPASSCKALFRGGSTAGDADEAWGLSSLAFGGELAGFLPPDPFGVFDVKKLVSEACLFSAGFEEPAMVSWWMWMGCKCRRGDVTRNL